MRPAREQFGCELIYLGHAGDDSVHSHIFVAYTVLDLSLRKCKLNLIAWCATSPPPHTISAFHLTYCILMFDCEFLFLLEFKSVGCIQNLRDRTQFADANEANLRPIKYEQITKFRSKCDIYQRKCEIDLKQHPAKRNFIYKCIRTKWLMIS